MNYDLKVGFGRVDITPPLGSNIRGYFHQRIADGVLDALESNAVVVEKDGALVVFITLDCLYCTTEYYTMLREKISSEVGADKDAVFIHGTHTHTAPSLGAEDNHTNDIDREYYSYTAKKIVDCVKIAICDLQPAKMGIAFSKAERIGFNRRYLMKDGSTQTNPGVNNPNIVKSIGLLDETLNVVRFTRDCGDIVIANYGNHPDVIGGNKISADWPGLTRRVVEKTLDNVKCVFFNGAQGDINHVNVKPVGGDLNGMFNDFDDVTRGYTHSKHMANVVAGGIMSVFEKVEYIDTNSISFVHTQFPVASNMPKPEDMDKARYVQQMVDAGKENELPEKGMLLTTVKAEARRMIRLEHGPEFFQMHFTAIRIGDIVFAGIPGEPFTGIGLGLKSAEGYKMILPCCLTNASQGYFPMQDSYAEGGYEARSSNFKAGVAEIFIEEGKKILESLR